MIDIIGTLRHIYRRVNNLFALVNAIFTLQETGGVVTPTVINTQYDVYRVDNPMGVFKPLKVMLDFANQTAAETVVVRTFYRITSGGALTLKDELSFIGVQAVNMKNVELEPNRHGVQVTIERIAGSAVNYEWMAAFEA